MIDYMDVKKLVPEKYILAADIPALQLKKGMIISSSIIELLLKFGIFTVTISENKTIQYKVIDQKVLDESYNKIQDFWQDMKQNNKVDIEVVEETADTIVESALKNFGEVISIPLLKLRDFDQYTYTHTLNVGILSVLIGKSFGLDEAQLKKLSTAGILHDIGKTKVGVEIINAERALTPEELEIVRKHVYFGKTMCIENNITDSDIIGGVYEHHERFDGKGYLEGLSGMNISLFGRLLCVADVYDALSAKRSYKEPWNYYKIVSHILQNTGKMFDPVMVSAFVNVFGIYPPGTRVLLNNNLIGTVIGTRVNNKFQPMIQIEDEIIDLSKGKIFISKVLE